MPIKEAWEKAGQNWRRQCQIQNYKMFRQAGYARREAYIKATADRRYRNVFCCMGEPSTPSPGFPERSAV
jgi:hypothetical protein